MVTLFLPVLLECSAETILKLIFTTDIAKPASLRLEMYSLGLQDSVGGNNETLYDCPRGKQRVWFPRDAHCLIKAPTTTH